MEKISEIPSIPEDWLHLEVRGIAESDLTRMGSLTVIVSNCNVIMTQVKVNQRQKCQVKTWPLGRPQQNPLVPLQGQDFTLGAYLFSIGWSQREVAPP